MMLFSPDSPLHHSNADTHTVTLSQVVFPRDTDALGHATAGYLLKLVDIVGSLSARRHTHANVVTASLDCMDFINPILMWDVVSATAQVTQVWTTSLEVLVTVTSTRYTTGEFYPIAQGYMVFVTLDDEMKPTKAKPLTFETTEARLMAQNADLRRQTRIMEKKQQASWSQIAIEPDDKPAQVKRLMTTDDANIYHNVFGGVILEMTHLASMQAAWDFLGKYLTTVRQDRMSFEQPAIIGELITSQATVTRTWESSIEVIAEVFAELPEEGEMATKRKIANSYLVFVALDKQGRSERVPEFKPTTLRQQKRWEDAQLRREIRLGELKTKKAFQ